MTIQLARNVGPASIDIAYECLGDPRGIPVLLIMGIGTQLLGWPDGFCDALVQRGMYVVRFDNRDVGESTHMTSAPMPDMAAALAGNFASASYTLSDMAADSVGLLDALGIATAHVIGASMGGFIAQTIAIEYPRRVRSLTSMMSSTGARDVGQIHPHVLAAVFGGPPALTRDQVIAQRVDAMKLVGSTAFAQDLEAVAERVGRAFDRSHDPLGMARQGIAVLASGDRTPRLRTLDVPTLVVHGTVDPMCDVSGGHATAAAIPGAELLVIGGMGHDLPRALWPTLAARIDELVQRVERSAQT